jgi:hypothetical protein
MKEMDDLICIVPNCGKSCMKGGHARGMCGPCYQHARRLVVLRKTTWRELEDAGLAIPPVRKISQKPTPLVELALHQYRMLAREREVEKLE